jgi:hypothetical protein
VNLYSSLRPCYGDMVQQHVKECRPLAYHSLHLSREDEAYPHLEIIQSFLNWWRSLDILHWNSLESGDTTHRSLKQSGSLKQESTCMWETVHPSLSQQNSLDDWTQWLSCSPSHTYFSYFFKFMVRYYMFLIYSTFLPY